MNLWQKLIEIRKEVPFLKKEASGYGYKYNAGSQVLGAIRKKMDELNVLLIPSIKTPSNELVMVRDKNGEHPEMVVKVEMSYTWKNAEKPEELEENPWFAIGQQKDPAQALGSALTYSERYFIMKYFNIPTDEDDPDFKGNKPGGNQQSRPAPKTPPQGAQTGHTSTQAQNKGNGKVISEAQRKRLFAIANQHSIKHEEVKEIISHYGYDSTKNIAQSDYEKICNEIAPEPPSLEKVASEADKLKPE